MLFSCVYNVARAAQVELTSHSGGDVGQELEREDAVNTASNNAMGGPANASTAGPGYRYLLFFAAPLGVLGIANLLFEHSLAPLEPALEFIDSLFTTGSANKVALSTPHEIRARYLWLATCITALVIGLLAIGIAWWTCRRCLSARQFKMAVGLVVAIVIMEAIYVWLTPNTVRQVNYEFTLRLLEQSRVLPEQFLHWDVAGIAILVVVVSVAAAVFLFLAAGSTVQLPAATASDDICQASINMARLRNVLYVGSVVLVVGVINMGSWLRWPAALFKESGHDGAILGFALGVTTFWGAAFTLAAVAAYIPPALYLRTRALDVFRRRHPGTTSAAQEQWLKKQGFTISPGSQLAPIVAMLSPMIAGPLGALLNEVMKQLGE